MKKQYHALKEEIDEAIKVVLERGVFINGPEVQQFSVALAEYLNVNHVVPCASGTDAIQIALMALDLKLGDEVIVPAFGYAAAVEVILLLGLKPVFVDVCEKTFNIDVTKIEAKITINSKVILPIHLFGQCADMEEILSIAEKHKLYVIEDVAQSIGSVYAYSTGEVKKAGTIGDIGCTSFFPSKNLSCFGDGGAVFSNDKALSERMKMIANHGQSRKYIHEIVGINSRLDTIQAAVLNVKLKYLEAFNTKRKSIADRYSEVFQEFNFFKTPQISRSSTHVFHQYTIQLEKEKERDDLQEFLKNNKISTAVYYPMPISSQKAYQAYDKDEYVVANHLSKCVLSLPVYPELRPEEQNYIIETIKKFYN